MIFTENDPQISQISNPSKQFSKLTTFTKYNCFNQISRNYTQKDIPKKHTKDIQKTSKNTNRHITLSHCKSPFFSIKTHLLFTRTRKPNSQPDYLPISRLCESTHMPFTPNPPHYSFTAIFSPESLPCPLSLSSDPLFFCLRCFRSSRFLSSLPSFSKFSPRLYFRFSCLSSSR